jgi:uncharacterized protein YkwD
VKFALLFLLAAVVLWAYIFIFGSINGIGYDILSEIPLIDEFIKNMREEHRIEQAQLEEEQRISDKKYIQDIKIKVHQLVNEERRDYGLRHLSWNEKLAQAALNHSTDMASRGYYAHDSPEGHDFSWRYSQIGFSCSVVRGNMIYGGAENLMFLEGHYGVDNIATVTVDGWMDSPGHRKNMLNPDWRSEGIGVSMSGNKIYITQNFC